MYFPISGVISMVGLADQRSAIEVATIGFEDVVGLPLFLGVTTSPTAAFCQIPAVPPACPRGTWPSSSAATAGCTPCCTATPQTTMAQLSQNVVCNSAHTAEQRAARWLLTSSDGCAATGSC
jgi:hypothetical protein